MATTLTIPDDVKAVLCRSKITENTVTLPEQLERPLYVKTDKILKALGVVWNKKLGCHVGNPAVNLHDEFAFALATGEVLNHQQINQEFFTPPELAERLVDQVASNMIFPHHRNTYVLEPSAGSGNLVRAMLERSGTKFSLVLVEQQPKLAEDLKREFLTDKDNVVLNMDFLWLNPKIFVGFDIVLMNPPFSGGQDMMHITHAFQFVRPGGHLVAITSPAWHTGKNHAQRAFQDFVEDNLFPGTQSMQHFEAGAFKQSGTNVKTMMIHLYRKPTDAAQTKSGVQ